MLIRAHRGSSTCSHYPKEPHYAWNINGAKQSAKMENGEREKMTEGSGGGGSERWKVRNRDGWKQYVFITKTWLTEAFSKMIFIQNHHFYHEHCHPTQQSRHDLSPSSMVLITFNNKARSRGVLKWSPHIKSVHVLYVCECWSRCYKCRAYFPFSSSGSWVSINH